MIDRRQFSFGALLLAVAPPAAGYDGAQGPEPLEPSLPRFDARFSVYHADGELSVGLELYNLGADPVSVLARVGARPGPSLRAVVDEVELRPTTADPGAMSRLGPAPMYEVLAGAHHPGSRLAIGTYTFAAPTRPKQVELSAVVSTDHGSVATPARRVVLLDLGLIPKA